MSDRKRGAYAKSKVETKQKTLLDLFPRKSVRSEKQPVDNEREDEGLRHEPEVTTTTCDAHTADPDGTVRATNGIKPPNSRPKPLHPLFAERSRASKAEIQTVVTEDEIIELSSDEPSLTLLPLSGSHLSIDSPEPCSSQPGGSQEDPIILDSSPARPLSLPSQYKPSHPAIKPPVMLPVPPRAKPSKSRDADVAPYPDRMSQHVRGPQQTYSSPHIPYSQRLQRYEITTTSNLLSAMKLEQDTNNAVSSTDTMNFLPYTLADKESYLGDIPKEHSRLHPAILRVMNAEAAHPIVSPLEHKAWVDKWRPTRAEEVLGNEANAVYLRDWLRALELQFETSSPPTTQQGTRKAAERANGNKRPRVVRAVTKHRGRKKRRIDSDDEDDWIVHGDEFEDEASWAAEISDDIEQESSSHLYQKESHADSVPSASSNHFSSHLTNTILLAGPSGTGKTAAAYACADELGWEVFEVYPGIGKRNGASIENMIGDVGKNHLVRKTQRGGETIRPSKGSDAFAALLGKDKNPADEEPQDSHSGDFGFVSRSDNQPGQGSGGASTVRQSLILLEEVDILFKEDSNFWPTVTNFIKDCKRPVICTCNDVSLIPTLDLPLQTILTFQACPAPVATSYLQGLCYAEGYSVERDSLLELYERTDPSVSASAMFVESQVPDLRRTINCLQFQCLTCPPSGRMVRCQTDSESSIEDLSDWSWPHSYPTMDAKFQIPRRPVMDHAELISFVDSQLSDFDTSQAFNEFEPTTDDEVGHTILFPAVPKTASGFEFRHRDIASTAMRLSRGVLERGIKQVLTSDVNNGFRTRALFRARVGHQLQMVEGLKNMVPLSMWVMRDCVIHMDYGPWIRHIVAEEDMQEALYLKRERTGRMTRNSGGEYVRTMRITEEERKALAVCL